MSTKQLQHESKRIRGDVGREYQKQRVMMIQREIKRETNEEIRAAIREVCNA